MAGRMVVWPLKRVNYRVGFAGRQTPTNPFLGAWPPDPRDIPQARFDGN
jgi:hypothetical protein